MDTCKKYIEKIPLSIYGELDDIENAELQVHLRSCEVCHREYHALQTMLTEIPQEPLHEAEEESLHLLRNLVSQKLKPKTRTKNGFDQGIFSFIIQRPVFQFGFAALLIALGFFIGKSTENKANLSLNENFKTLVSAQENLQAGNAYVQPYILGINKIEYDPATGKISIDYNTINDIQMQGAASDRSIHALLQQAVLANEDYNVRLQALKTVRAVAHQTPAAFDDSYLQVFNQILNQETDLGLRLQVLKILDVLPWNEQLKTLLQQVLIKNSEDALRIAAFRTITERESKKDELTDVLAKAQHDTSTFIKYRSEKLLEELRNSEATPLRREK